MCLLRHKLSYTFAPPCSSGPSLRHLTAANSCLQSWRLASGSSLSVTRLSEAGSQGCQTLRFATSCLATLQVGHFAFLVSVPFRIFCVSTCSTGLRTSKLSATKTIHSGLNLVMCSGNRRGWNKRSLHMFINNLSVVISRQASTKD